MRTIFERVKILLEKYPEARELKNRKRFEWLYWRTYDGIGETMTKDQYISTTPVESIDREWRKAMEMVYPDMPREERDLREFEQRNEQQLVTQEYIENELKKEYKKVTPQEGMEIIKSKIRGKLRVKHET